MELSEIVAITGMPGLYKISARRNDGLIVTSLADNKTQFVSGRTHMFTTLDNVTMYTTDEPVALKDVLAAIKKNGAVPDGKDDAKTKSWLEQVLPNYDKEKVYVSDMKKLLRWYTLLNDKNLIEELTAEKKAEAAAEEKEEVAEKTSKAAKEDKPKKESKPKVKKDTAAATSKKNTKPAPAAKKVSAPRKAQ